MAYFRQTTKYIPSPIPVEPPYTPPYVPDPPTPERGSDAHVDRPTFTGQYTIELYINTSDNSVVHKTLDNISSTIVSLYNCDVVNPVITIESNTDLTKCNYIKLNGYYYYANVRLINDNLYELSCHMDGLMSCDLSSCRCSVSKSASNYNSYLHDNIPCVAYIENKTLAFNKGFSKNLNYLLVTIGGVNNA